MSFLVNWFWNALSFLGLSNKSARIVFLGLDNAGKTTLLHTLRNGRVIVHEPTRYPQADELVIGNVKFATHDLGGHEAARRLWKNYYSGIDGLVFLVDAADRDRVDDARQELANLLEDEILKNVPFVILGNKVDQKDAMDPTELAERLGVEDKLTGKEGNAVGEDQRPLELFMCSVYRRSGYADGFKWLANYLK